MSRHRLQDVVAILLRPDRRLLQETYEQYGGYNRPAPQRLEYIYVDDGDRYWRLKRAGNRYEGRLVEYYVFPT